MFTYKAGLLARAAHDLRLRLETFQVTLDGEKMHGDFDLRSLRVEGPVEGGVVRRDLFDKGERTEIERAMNAEVLHTDRYPTARFEGLAPPRGKGLAVAGTLALVEREVPLAFDVRWEDGAYRAELEIRPSRWGIAPYRALLGTIRLQDRVRIELALTDA